MRKSPTRQKLKSQGVRQEKQRPEEPTKPSRAWESWAAEMALRMLWTGQGKGILGGWRSICLVISLLLQHPGVNSKCYFQAQGKVD